ncbi:MAG: hypothetical protein AAFZ15_15020 [Bacteroidota bacterium]
MNISLHRTRAQESRAAIQRLYIAMRHLFIRGGYKPLGVSGEAMINAMMELRPEIYGVIADPERVELEGLLYVFQRLPIGIEECRYIRLISREGFEKSGFEPIVPSKRRRNCYRIDEEQMLIEVTKGRSDIYDVLTHLTFLYIEAEKIRRNGLDSKNRQKRDYLNLRKIIGKEKAGGQFSKEVASTYLATLIGRTFDETFAAVEKFEEASDVNSLFHIIYYLGKLAIEEAVDDNDREITFSSALREKIGHHIYGELWADNIKEFIYKKNWFDRPIHIISSNPHSVMNSLYAHAAIEEAEGMGLKELAAELSLPENSGWRKAVEEYAHENGMCQLEDSSGTNLTVQIFDTTKIDVAKLPAAISWTQDFINNNKPVLVVMDYAFGEQAYEVMDELLKPFEPVPDEKIPMNIASISIMGKAGILMGGKGDIMVPTAHVFEGTADNYPFENDFTAKDFEENGLGVCEGPMITVLGTSLSNKDILRYFLKSSWEAIGLEMEGAHYQKAIQAASKIRNSIDPNVRLRYAYYASDNPLVTGHTLASGALGVDGVKPTYLITVKILNKIALENSGGN